MTLFVFVAFAILISYCVKIFRFSHAWENYPKYSKSFIDEELPSISIVIPFRNEINNITDLLNCLEKQLYPKEKLEVILIDDHSADGSEKIARDFCNQRPDFFYLLNSKAGKKSALNMGIMTSKNELILTTDADCIMKNRWVEIIADFYLKYKPDIITGLVDIKTGKGFFNRFQEIDFLSLIASGAASCITEKAIYCNAANLAFKKELFININDPFFNKAESGDDTFLLHNAKKNKKKIMLLKSPDTIVTTYGVNSFKEFINQRIRWISKSKYYRDKDAIYTSILVFLMNMLCLSTFLMLVSGINLCLFPAVMFLKIFADYSLLKSFIKFYGRKADLRNFIIMSIIYPFIILLILFFTVFGKYQWKGR